MLSSLLSPVPRLSCGTSSKLPRFASLFLKSRPVLIILIAYSVNDVQQLIPSLLPIAGNLSSSVGLKLPVVTH